MVRGRLRLSSCPCKLEHMPSYRRLFQICFYYLGDAAKGWKPFEASVLCRKSEDRASCKNLFRNDKKRWVTQFRNHPGTSASDAWFTNESDVSSPIVALCSEHVRTFFLIVAPCNRAGLKLAKKCKRTTVLFFSVGERRKGNRDWMWEDHICLRIWADAKQKSVFVSFFFLSFSFLSHVGFESLNAAQSQKQRGALSMF